MCSLIPLLMPWTLGFRRKRREEGKEGKREKKERRKEEREGGICSFMFVA